MMLGYQATKSARDRTFNPLTDCIPYDQMEANVWEQARNMYAAAKARYTGSRANHRDIADDDWQMIHDLMTSVAGTHRLRPHFRNRSLNSLSYVQRHSSGNVAARDTGTTRTISSPNFCWRRALLIFSKKTTRPKSLTNFWVVSIPLTWGMDVLGGTDLSLPASTAFRLPRLTLRQFESRGGLLRAFHQTASIATLYSQQTELQQQRRLVDWWGANTVEGLKEIGVLHSLPNTPGMRLTVPTSEPEGRHMFGLDPGQDPRTRIGYFDIDYLKATTEIKPWVAEPYWSLQHRFVGFPASAFPAVYRHDSRRAIRMWPMISGRQLYQRYGKSNGSAWSSLIKTGNTSIGPATRVESVALTQTPAGSNAYILR